MSSSPTSRESLRPDRDDIRRLLALAGPVVLVHVGTMSMGVVDTIMVGHVSAADLAGVALGNLYYYGLTVFGYGLLMALDPIVAQAVGAGEWENVARALQRGLVMAVALTLVVAGAFVPVGPVLTLLGQPPEVVARAAGFVRNSIPGLLPFFAFIVLRQSLQAMHRTGPIVWTILSANVLNAFLNWVFVYGHLGSPRLGGPGSGIATSCARWGMTLMLLTIAWRDLVPLIRPWRRASLAIGPLLRTVRLGVSIGVQNTLEVGVFSVVGLLMGRLGPAAMAGHQVALNIASFTFMVPLGVSASAAVLVGHAIGAGEPARARRAAVAALGLGAAFMAMSGLVLSFIPTLLARAYSPEAPVIAIAAALLPIAGVFQIFDGIQVVAIGVLRGMGDTRTPMVVNMIGYWLLGLPLSLGLAYGLGFGATGLWWGLVVGLAVVAIVLLVRVRARLSGALERVRIEDPARAAEAIADA